MEILAPAGNFEMLKAAVINGADAVYLGLDKYSARAKAENFDDNLAEAIEYAHIYGVKVYVAINTLIKNEEMDDALNAAMRAYECKADAFIVQDLGFAQLLRKKCPKAIMHASTQLGIHNAEGALIAKKLGFSRVILSRETLLEDIKEIKKRVDIEIECFVQGALCISFSGNCYFSSFASGYSGNRGKCMQLCRKKYKAVVNGKSYEGYLLSAKDLMLADKLNLLDGLVDCIKIEGRMRRPEYVAESVRIYKKVLETKRVTEDDVDALKKVFNRGDYTEGHLCVGTQKLLDTKIASHKGLFYCKVVSVKGRTLKAEKTLMKGDGIKILRSGYEVGSASVSKTGNETGFAGNVKAGDDIFITTDERASREILSRKRKLTVDIDVNFDERKISLLCGAANVELTIENVLTAEKLPITNCDIKTNFDKSPYFETGRVTLEGKNAFMTKADFNELRRSSYRALIDEILWQYNAKMPIYEGNCLTLTDIISKDIDLFLQDRTIYQVDDIDQITDEMEVIALNPTEYSVDYLMKFAPYFDRMILNLPFIARGKDIEILKKIIAKCPFKGYIANNLYALDIVHGAPVIAGFGLNILNDVTDIPKIYSIESDRIGENGYTYALGNIPLMTFCHCEKKELSNGCENCKGYDITLTYENRDFRMRRYKIHYCYGQLLNCADLDITRLVKQKIVIDYSYRRTDAFTKGNYGRGLK